jgi:phenylalanyl-tRNA synthetase beta chain
VARLLGVAIPAEAIVELFGRLGLKCARDGDELLVTPPTYRFDLAIEEDFVEEVARLWGYDAIPAAPAAHVQGMLGSPETATTASALKHQLAARDWQEVITFTFVSSARETALFPAREERAAPIAVVNPIASHLDVMRTTLAGGLIEVLATNLARKQDRVRVFEVGRCFLRADGTYEQPLRIGGLAYGDAHPEQWGTPKRPVDLFDVKGPRGVGARPLTTQRRTPGATSGRAATVRMTVRRSLAGELHPRLTRQFELPRADRLRSVAPLQARCRPPARVKLPVVRRDPAVDDDSRLDVLATLEAARPPCVEAIDCSTSSAAPESRPARKALRF